MTESEIIKGCIKQDRNCQKALYEMFYGKMMGVCLRYAKDRDHAQDVLQDAFMKVFDKIKNFNSTGSFEGWVRRIMVNTAIDALRKNKQEYSIVSTVHAQKRNEDPEEETSDDDILNHVTKEDVLNAVHKLSPAYRAVFNLYVVEEYSHKEIAEMLGISEGTSKSNFAKAKYNLKKLLIHLIPQAND